MNKRLTRKEAYATVKVAEEATHEKFLQTVHEHIDDTIRSAADEGFFSCRIPLSENRRMTNESNSNE